MNSDGWEESPSYWQLLSAIWEFLLNRLQETPSVGRSHFNFCWTDVFFVVLSAVLWTFLRQVVTESFLKPLGLRCGLSDSNLLKMPESGWKFLYYLCAFSIDFYILVLSGDYKFFQKPSTVWDDWSLSKSLPMNMYLFYIGQCGFYLHSLYATIFMDIWRKDSNVMIIHHTSTLILIALSFALRCHNIGCVVLFLHDVCDIFLEASKLNVYFTIQHNNTVKMHELLANLSFTCFTIIWYVARLYWYPLRVLFVGISNVNDLQSVLPCSLLMNGLLWVLQIMNLYWFYFILQTIYRVLTGQMQGDAREYDVQEKLRTLRKESSTNKAENGGTSSGKESEDDQLSNRKRN